MALCVEHVLRREKGPIVINCASSRMSQDLAERTACRLFARPLARRMSWTPCSPKARYSAARAMAARSIRAWAWFATVSSAWPCCWTQWPSAQQPIGAMADDLPRYEIVKTKISLPKERITAGLAALEAHFNDAAVNRMDGLRFDWPDRWLLVRGSNTEPIVRAIAEAPTANEAKRLCDEAAGVLQSL